MSIIKCLSLPMTISFSFTKNKYTLKNTYNHKDRYAFSQMRSLPLHGSSLL